MYDKLFRPQGVKGQRPWHKNKPHINAEPSQKHKTLI